MGAFRSYIVVTVLLCLGGSRASPRLIPLAPRSFALEDLVPLRFDLYPEGVNVGEWISETEYVLVRPSKVQKYKADTKEYVDFLSDKDLSQLKSIPSAYSNGRKYALISHDKKKVFRRSHTAQYTVYHLKNKSLYPVAKGLTLQSCMFSPREGALAYVRDNNVFYLHNVTDPDTERALTHDGIPGEVYNGHQDWVYEEEVFEAPDAMWFSTAGTFLAVVSFNDSLVDDATYSYYGYPNNLDFQYPEIVHYKYPKAGRNNPVVKLRVHSVTEKDSSPNEIVAPVEEVGEDHILGDVSWASDNLLVVLWLNRRQNISVLVTCDILMDECHTVRKETEPEGWIDISRPLFDGSGARMVYIRPLPYGDDRYPHVALLDLATFEVMDLSPGNSTATSLLGWNQDTHTVFYQVSPANAPWERQLWASSNNKTSCVTCGIQNCHTVQADFAPQAGYAVLTCSATNVPPHIYLYDTKNQSFTLWNDNAHLTETLQEYSLPKPVTKVIELKADVKAHVKMLLPPNITPGLKYPMVVRVYAGPGSTFVSDSYRLDYHTYQASNRSFVVCFIDVRGSGVMGMKAMHAVNNALGTVEITDTLAAIRQLVATHDFIDASRVGVWGWSYGGYAASMMLAHDHNGTLACAAAVAPVTSWLYYDTIYTERYMDLPQHNRLGYERSELLRVAGGIRGRPFLLAHGSADDNVHYQHSMMLAKLLQHSDIDFEEMGYVDENHSLQGVSRHLYHTLERFWTKCFE